MDATQQTLKAQLEFGLSDRLTKSLHVAGLTNLDMAHALEVSQNTVSNYINGRTRPRKLYLREWALKTGVPIEWLETGIFPEDPENKKAPTSNNGDEGIRAAYRTRTDPYALQVRHLRLVA